MSIEEFTVEELRRIADALIDHGTEGERRGASDGPLLRNLGAKAQRLANQRTTVSAPSKERAAS